MDFKQAFKLMKDGNKVKLPSWGGYWCWNDNEQTIQMHCRPQDSDLKEKNVLDIRETLRVEYTIQNILSDEWILADETNTPLLGGVATFGFDDAIKYLKRGMKVSRKGWNGRGMWVACEKVYTHTNLKVQDIESTFSHPLLIIKNVNGQFATWVPSITDLFAEDWTLID